MKFSLSLAGVIAFFLSASAWAGSDIRFSDIRGDVQVKNAAGAMRTVKIGDAVAPGESVLTGANALAILKFEDGHVIALKDDTDFTVRSYRYEAAAPAQNSMLLSLVKGGLRSITGMLGRSNKQAFELRTPTATMGIRGSDWLTALQNNNLYSGVNSGGISITNGVNSLALNAGQYSATIDTTATQIVNFAQIPAGIFGVLPALTFPGIAATGFGTGAATTGLSASTIAIGAALAGVLTAVANDGSSTSHSATHH